MERDHPGEVVQEQAEVQEWVELAEEEWAAQRPVQVQPGSAHVLSAELLYLMKPEFPVSTRSAQNAGPKW
jgi:hypothetical protein